MIRISPADDSGKPERTSSYPCSPAHLADDEVYAGEFDDDVARPAPQDDSPPDKHESTRAAVKPRKARSKPEAETERAKQRRRRDFFVDRLEAQYHAFLRKRKEGKVRPILIPGELLRGYTLQALVTRHWYLAMITRALLMDVDRDGWFAMSALEAATGTKHSFIKGVVRDEFPGPVWRELCAKCPMYRRDLFYGATRKLLELGLIEQQGKKHKTRYRITGFQGDSHGKIPI